jgi:hypothetical protein
MTMGYKIQIDDLVRDATDEEAAALDAQKAEAQAEADAQAAKAAARQAVLDKLGLTANEAQALLG